MKWLLLKDLQILRRSPLQLALLIIYPVAVALLVGFALSSFLSSIVSLLAVMSEDRLHNIFFWLMGGLGRSFQGHY